LFFKLLKLHKFPVKMLSMFGGAWSGLQQHIIDEAIVQWR